MVRVGCRGSSPLRGRASFPAAALQQPGSELMFLVTVTTWGSADACGLLPETMLVPEGRTTAGVPLMWMACAVTGVLETSRHSQPPSSMSGSMDLLQLGSVMTSMLA